VTTIGRLAAAVLILLLGGCAPAQTGEVRTVATDFQTRIAAHDWPGACGLLSDQVRAQLEATAARPCAQALEQLRLSGAAVVEVQVWGRNARAALPSGTVFLSRFVEGWRVIGAGCTWRGEDQPYACSVRG
jgi:hypothetical protein